VPANGTNGKHFWLTDGSVSFQSGVDSGRVPTIQNEQYPEGLKRSNLAWLGNGTVRGGKISARFGYQPVVQKQTWSGLFQGAYMYEPEGGDPYIVMGVGGHAYQVRVDTDNSVHDISAGVFNPANPRWYFVQGEMFLIIQDGNAFPRVWDGTTMRRINQFPPGPWLPTGTIMQYFMGRLWLSPGGPGGREFLAGDIVGNTVSGTGPYNFKDSILKQTENAFLAGGGRFIVPSNAGSIRAMFYTSELDTTLGQGRLYVGTRKNIYAMNVPVTRTDWVATTNNTLPLQTIALLDYGPVNDRCIVGSNADVFFQTLEPAIRSLTLARRYFEQWGNTQISGNENRVLAFNDRSLLAFASGIQFNNRMLQTCLPFQTPVGVAHRGIIPLDFDLISSLGEKYPPAWEGMWEGLQVLQMVVGNFGGVDRAFAIVLSQESNQIEIWELTTSTLRDNGDNRITYFFETPAFTCGRLLELKRLVSGQIWVDDLYGTVDFTVEWRVDQSPCWNLWHKWQECSARTCLEADIPCGYPIQPLCAQNRIPMTLPKPQQPAACDPNNKRPVDIGYQFQLRVTVKGTASIRGVFINCEPVETAAYYGLVC